MNDDPFAIYYGIVMDEEIQPTRPPRRRRFEFLLLNLISTIKRTWLFLLLFTIMGGLYIISNIEKSPSNIQRAFFDTMFSPVGMAGFIILLLALVILRMVKLERRVFLKDLSTELVSIAITILALGTLTQWQNIQEKHQNLLIRNIREGSTSSVTQRSLSTLREQGWLYDGTLWGADLVSAKLSRAQLWESNLTGAYLTNADMLDATLRDSQLIGTQLDEAILTNASLSGADLSHASLRYAALEYTVLIFSVLRETDLEGANLTGARLYEADLSGANLSRAILVDTDLRNADLSETRLGLADLSGARYNRFTIWPDGFEPGAAGAINVDRAEP